MYMWFVDGCATIARPLNDLSVGHPTNSVVKKTKSVVLGQNQQGNNRVNAYASHRLKPAEKNYLAHKLEFLALKWAVSGKFYNLLYGTKFEAITDNNPLTYILTTAKLVATGQCLLSYNFDIKHRCGNT